MRKNSGRKIVQTPYYKSPPVDIILNYAKSDVPGTVAMDITVLSEATPCILDEIYPFFEENFCSCILQWNWGQAGCSEKQATIYQPKNRQVAGSILDGVIGIFQWHNPTGRSLALRSTQPLTEMSTRCVSLG